MSRRRSFNEACMLAALRAAERRLQARDAQPHRAWGDSWWKIALGAALIIAALAAWLW